MVEIPNDVAKSLAQWHRDMAEEPGPVPFTADWLAAQPIHTADSGVFCDEQRDHDVRLLRGQHG